MVVVQRSTNVDTAVAPGVTRFHLGTDLLRLLGANAAPYWVPGLVLFLSVALACRSRFRFP